MTYYTLHIYLEIYVCMLSHFSHVQFFATPWTVACQDPLSMGNLQARILVWVAMFSPRGSSEPETEPASLMSPALAGRFFTISANWKAPLFGPFC